MKRLTGLLAVAALALLFLGCPEKKGPMEKAGAKMDKAADSVRDAVKHAADDISDAAKDVKKDLEKDN